MKRKLISSGSSFEKEIGYSRAVVDGNLVFVSGITGFDYEKMTIEDDIVSQTEQCLKNIVSTLKKQIQKSKMLLELRTYYPILMSLNNVGLY